MGMAVLPRSPVGIGAFAGLLTLWIVRKKFGPEGIDYVHVLRRARRIRRTAHSSTPSGKPGRETLRGMLGAPPGPKDDAQKTSSGWRRAPAGGARACSVGRMVQLAIIGLVLFVGVNAVADAAHKPILADHRVPAHHFVPAAHTK
jgi:hypothetical protein